MSMYLRTHEMVPRVFWATDTDSLVMLLWLSSDMGRSLTEYMAHANARLTAQGRTPIETHDTRRFLDGLVLAGIVHIEEE